MTILYLIVILIILYTIGWIILLPFRLLGSVANNLRLKNAILKTDLKVRKVGEYQRYLQEENKLLKEENKALENKKKENGSNVIRLIKK